MNKLILALTLAATLVGCSNSTKPVEEVKAPVMELSAGKIACFDIAQTIQENSKITGQSADEYIEDNCGTDAERAAFKSGQYVKK